MSNALDEYKQIISQTKEKSPIFIKAAATNHTDVLSSSVFTLNRSNMYDPREYSYFGKYWKGEFDFTPNIKRYILKTRIPKNKNSLN